MCPAPRTGHTTRHTPAPLPRATSRPQHCNEWGYLAVGLAVALPCFLVPAVLPASPADAGKPLHQRFWVKAGGAAQHSAARRGDRHRAPRRHLVRAAVATGTLRLFACVPDRR